MNIRNNIPYLLIIICLLLFIFWRSCDRRDTPIPNSRIENAKAEAVKAEDQFKEAKAVAETLYVDRKVYRDRWRTVSDSAPCETLISLCDTLILKDDTLIEQQRIALLEADTALKAKDVVIAVQDTLILANEKTISVLTKKVKRQRLWNRILAALVIGSAGAAIVK